MPSLLVFLALNYEFLEGILLFSMRFLNNKCYLFYYRIYRLYEPGIHFQNFSMCSMYAF